MSSNKKSLIRTIFSSKSSCGCGKLKSTDVHEPKTKSKISTSTHQNPPNSSSHNSSSSISNDHHGLTIKEEDFSFTFNLSDRSIENSSDQYYPRRTLMLSPCPKIVDSIAVEKDSNDPYGDFYHSMLGMITEKEIYSKDDLQELLKCFLELNSATHHDIIIQAYKEIYKGVVARKDNK
ncbi:hypothetical protein ACFE04_016661 [Oxalis oulophora]